MDAVIEHEVDVKCKKLKEELRMLKEWATLYREENKKLREEKDFFYKSAKQFREDAESWRKECERLLWLQLCWKTIAERIEDDKKVVRE